MKTISDKDGVNHEDEDDDDDENDDDNDDDNGEGEAQSGLMVAYSVRLATM